jgi:endosialidase-like protein
VNVGAGAAPVFVNTLSGQLGTIASTKRVKEAIEDMGKASRGLLRLRPVTFRYRQPAEDGSQPRQYGLIAEEVATVYPELVAYGSDGEPSTVAYHLLPAMLLNEWQRQAAELAGQQAQIAAQAAQLATQEVRLREQAQEMAALRALVEELRAGSGTRPVTVAR